MKRIGIIGGGPGGLTLARLLMGKDFAVTVFEREAHPLERPQGGSLDLHDDSGLLALEAAGLMDQFRKYARYEDQGGRIYDSQATLHHEHIGGDGRPEIDRTQLRSILLDSLPADLVRWGSKVDGIEAQGARFGVNGEVFDLIVGADGAWSKVRPLVSDVKPTHTGVNFTELSLDDIDRRYPELAALVGSGKIMVFGRGRALIAQRSSNGHLRVYVPFMPPEETATSKAAVKNAIAGWAPIFQSLIDAANSEVVSRTLVALPPGETWKHRAGVTLLGDAAHVMSPFGGDGVNMAMQDALELSKVLTSGGDLENAIADYEVKMAERLRERSTFAAIGLASFIGPNGLQEALDFFRGEDAH